MSSTRYARPGADPDESPERYLASGRLRGIGLGLNLIARVASVLPDEERAAMLWLCNFARLCGLTADAVEKELALDMVSIRRALTDPECDRAAFVRQVAALRARFESEMKRARPMTERSAFSVDATWDESLRPIADTKVRRKTANAIRMAAAEPNIVEVIGQTRMGKSVAARREFLSLMHRAIWVTCPNGTSERDFLLAFASAASLGVGSTTLKNAQILPKLLTFFGRARIDMVFVDEGHRLWPHDAGCEPKRIEFLRDLWEHRGVSVVVIATPQFSVRLAEAEQSSTSWNAGQWTGRSQLFQIADSMSREDLAAVARMHAPDAPENVIAHLATQALATKGFCGSIVNTLKRARFRLADQPLTVPAIKEAERQGAREERTAMLGAKVVKMRPPRTLRAVHYQNAG